MRRELYSYGVVLLLMAFPLARRFAGIHAGSLCVTGFCLFELYAASKMDHVGVCSATEKIVVLRRRAVSPIYKELCGA